MTTRFKRTPAVLAAMALFLFSITGYSGEPADPFPVAGVGYGSSALTWQPKVEYGQLLLSVSAPDGSIFTKLFDRNSSPYYELSTLQDGTYSYELRVIPALENRLVRQRGEMAKSPASVQFGSFSVVGGQIVNPAQNEDLSATMDVLHYDDVIITGSLCIGWDCANGESFGYDTVKLKENNLRLFFEDTSIGSFPSGDWRIRINDTTNGGASYFAVEDGTNGRTPFRIETGAPTHALYVEDYGRVGLGTSIPYVELHIVDGDSPTIRLDQDGTSGWVAQRWDLCGNETNFFIRDVTNGSKLCFRIQPNTPSSTLCLRSTGNVGIGTWSPNYTLEVEKTGANAQIVAERTSGAQAILSATSSNAFIGALSNHALRLSTNNNWKMELDTDGGITMSEGGGTYNESTGQWVNGSSREYKENIEVLEVVAAMKALTKLEPVTFKFKKADAGEKQVGFIAEDVPELVAQSNRKGLAAMDIVAVLTKVVQEQQKTIGQQEKMLKKLSERIEKLEKK